MAIVPPLAAYRYQYIHAKRFREVDAGRLLPLRADDRRRVPRNVDRYHIKTVINLQHEEPDPLLRRPLARQGEDPRERVVPATRREVRAASRPTSSRPSNQLDMVPPAVEEFLKVLDDESNYPILLHCKAGLHRTGRLTAIYRMEYQGWSPGEALCELRANGYGYHRGQRGGRVHHPVRARTTSPALRPERLPVARRRAGSRIRLADAGASR